MGTVKNTGTPLTLSITGDATPFLLFAELFELGLKTSEGPLDLGQLPSELLRIESNVSAARAAELLIVFYPSDALLRFTAARLAGKLDLDRIKDLLHD